jgi:hypothetical protein
MTRLLKIGYTEQDVANLVKLGKYMATRSRRWNERHFRMTRYFSHEGFRKGIDGAINVVEYNRAIRKHVDCGTVVCALGASVFIFPNLRPLRHHSWAFLSNELYGVSEASVTWSVLFGPEWAAAVKLFDQSSYAVADRIAYLIENGPACYDRYWDRYDPHSLIKIMKKAHGSALKAGWLKAYPIERT